MIPQALRPTRLRLVRRDANEPAPRPPFGLAAWSVDADAIGLLLELPRRWPTSGFGDLRVVVEQVPHASTLPEGTRVFVLGEGARAAGILPRLFGGGRAPVARALRSSALLARGYVEIGAATDGSHDLAWGVAPTVTLVTAARL